MVDMGILILRIAVGLVMVAHGVPKLFWKRKVRPPKYCLISMPQYKHMPGSLNGSQGTL